MGFPGKCSKTLQNADHPSKTLQNIALFATSTVFHSFLLTTNYKCLIQNMNSNATQSSQPGSGSEKKPGIMGTTAYSEGNGHEILNHLGVRIRITERTLDALDVRGYLHRDKATGLKQISTKNFMVFVEAESTTSWYYELGSDCSGPNQVVCHCDKCKSKMHADNSNSLDIRTRQIVRDATAKRRYA
jgi:hypothetical protein